MIENPVVPVREAVDYEAEAPAGKRPRVAVKKLPVIDYDAEFDRLIQTVETTVCGIDAKLLREDRGRRVIIPVRSGRELVALPEVQKRIRDQ